SKRDWSSDVCSSDLRSVPDLDLLPVARDGRESRGISGGDQDLAALARALREECERSIREAPELDGAVAGIGSHRLAVRREGDRRESRHWVPGGNREQAAIRDSASRDRPGAAPTGRRQAQSVG